MKLSRKDVIRFWSKVDIISGDECWGWTDSIRNRRYGRLGINDKQVNANRVSWVIHFGAIPEGMHVLHHCDNPSCVNPEHLFLGTHQDNMADMKRKGRAISHFGENNGKSTLSTTEVIEIRKIYDSHKNKYGLTKLMSEVFEIPYGTIQKILRRYTWNHV
jgi:hypothetical protein